MVRNVKLLVVGLMAAVLALLGTSLSASAASVDPVLIAGNPDCGTGLKIDPVKSGTYDGVTIVVSGSSFSFSTDGSLVTDVVVKGGPNANWYSYPDPGVTSDSNLTAPINPNNGKPYGLSHLCFSVGDKQIPDPDPKK